MWIGDDDMKAVQCLKILDAGVGLGAAIIARHFSLLGCGLRRVEALNDPFYARYPAYETLHRGSERVDAGTFDAACAEADVIILGGEDYPGFDWHFDAVTVAARNPTAIVLMLHGGMDDRGQAVVANDLLAQARSGLCFEQLKGHPVAWSIPGPTFGMALQGLIAIWAALLVREESGEGQIVRSSLQRGAAMMCMPDRISFEREDDLSLAKIPYDVRQLIYPCADGRYIQFAMQRPGALARVYAVLGIPGEVDPNDTGAKRPDADPRDFFGNFELFSGYVNKMDRLQLLKALWDNQLGADLVLKPGECWDDEQVAINRIIARDDSGTRSTQLPIKFTEVIENTDVSASPRKARSVADKPLAGLRVVSLGTFIAGPYVSRALVDLGADVIKVDAPAGDPNTKVYTAWVVSNSGKRSIVIDLKQDEGLEILHRLCAGADMIYNNFRPGVAERIGVDPESLRHIAPRAVTLECSAYGPRGPKSTYSGLDPIAQAVAGLEVRAGGVGNDPLWLRMPIVDYSTGALGSIALLIARFEHLRSGHAIDAEINLLNTALFLNSELVQLPDGRFVGAPLNGKDQLGCAPFERLYQTLDGWVAIAAINDEMAARLTAALDVTEAIRGADEIQTAIAARLAQEKTLALLELLRENKIWAEEVRYFAGAIDEDPAAARIGLVAAAEHPHYGRIVSTAPLVDFEKSATAPVGIPPSLGEHTRELLTELGYGPDEIDGFYERRIVA